MQHLREMNIRSAINIVRQPFLTSLEFILREQFVPFRVIVDDGFDTQIQPLQLPESRLAV